MDGMRQVVVGHPHPCDACGATLHEGDLARIDDAGSKVVCAFCALQDETDVPSPVLLGVPGGSALREYHKRRRNDQERARRERTFRLVALAAAVVGGYLVVQLFAAVVDGNVHAHAKAPIPPSTAHELGVLVGLLVAVAVSWQLWGPRQTTEAWRRGALGERAVAARLAKVRRVVVLHDRRIPGTRVNIDHIIVGPSGVYVLDAKVGKGRVMARNVGSIWKPGPTKLFVGGRDRTSHVEGMARQLAAVSQALAHAPEAAGVAVRAMVVIVGAEWGFFTRPYSIQGVWVGWPKEAANVVGRPGPLSVEMRQRLAEELMARLPVA